MLAFWAALCRHRSFIRLLMPYAGFIGLFLRKGLGLGVKCLTWWPLQRTIARVGAVLGALVRPRSVRHDFCFLAHSMAIAGLY